MNAEEITRRKMAKWEERGRPICAVCHDQIHGGLNYTQWKQTGKCFSCQSSIDQVHYSQWRSVPPKGISKE